MPTGAGDMPKHLPIGDLHLGNSRSRNFDPKLWDHFTEDESSLDKELEDTFAELEALADLLPALNIEIDYRQLNKVLDDPQSDEKSKERRKLVQFANTYLKNRHVEEAKQHAKNQLQTLKENIDTAHKQFLKHNSKRKTSGEQTISDLVFCADRQRIYEEEPQSFVDIRNTKDELEKLERYINSDCSDPTYTLSSFTDRVFF